MECCAHPDCYTQKNNLSKLKDKETISLRKQTKGIHDQATSIENFWENFFGLIRKINTSIRLQARANCAGTIVKEMSNRKSLTTTKLIKTWTNLHLSITILNTCNLCSLIKRNRTAYWILKQDLFISRLQEIPFAIRNRHNLGWQDGKEYSKQTEQQTGVVCCWKGGLQTKFLKLDSFLLIKEQCV